MLDRSVFRTTSCAARDHTARSNYKPVRDKLCNIFFIVQINFSSNGSCSQHRRSISRRSISNMAIEDCTQPMHGNNITASSNLFRRKGDSTPRSSDKTYSLASVASHSTPSDCWVIVRDKVYDVTAWVPQHPGGALIYVSAGKDCTQLFDSYHPLYARYQFRALHSPTLRLSSAIPTLCCRAVLQKFYIGNLARQAGEVAAVTYQQPPEEQQFYTVLRQRVERYFRKNEVCSHAASNDVKDACSVD